MKNYIRIFLLALVFSSCATQNEQTLPTQIDHYKVQARALIKLNKKTSDPITLQKLAFDLIAQAKPIIQAHTKKYPACAQILNTIVAKAQYMTTLSLAKIEKDYHDGEALPQAPDECYEAKELIVHPATVIILTKTALNDEAREQINDEIEEVIAHIDGLL